MTDLPQLAWALLEAAIDRQFNPRHLRVLAAILAFSFRLGRKHATFPRLRHLMLLTGLERSHTSESLRWLIDHKVVELVEAGVYAVQAQDLQWRVPPRRESPELQELRAWLALPLGQMKLAAEPASLNDTLRDTLADARVQGLCRPDGGRNPEKSISPGAELPSVPVSGTPGASGNVPETGTGGSVPVSGTLSSLRDNELEKCSQNGNTAKLAVAASPCTPSSALNVQRLTLPEEAVNVERLKEGEYEGKPAAVPKTGTPAASQSQREFEREWLPRLESFFSLVQGPAWAGKQLKEYGGWYRNKMRENRGKFRRVFSACEEDRREGRLIVNWGGHFADLWNRFAD